MNTIKFSNVGYADITQADLKFLRIPKCGATIEGIENPKIESSLYTKDCQVIEPREGVSTDVLDIFCDRLNRFGEVKVSWKSTQKLNETCGYIMEYQTEITPFPHDRDLYFSENKNSFCGDSICIKSEIGNCCRDCSCVENEFCGTGNVCSLKQFNILNLSLVNQTLKVGEFANVTFNFNSNFPTSYNFTVLWSNQNSSLSIGWVNSSYISSGSSGWWWSTSPILDVAGNWESKLVVNSSFGLQEREINFTVEENLNFPKIIVVPN